MVKSLLDTDILSEYLKGYNQTVIGHAARYAKAYGVFTFTSVTVYDAHKLSPKILLPEHWQSRRRSQSPPPSDPVPIRVHPCPSVASSIGSPKETKISRRRRRILATDAHGCTRI